MREIDKALTDLKQLNPKLINYTASHLLDLIMEYQVYINKCRSRNGNYKITLDEFKNSNRFFKL
jgi:hypothetical protein